MSISSSKPHSPKDAWRLGNAGRILGNAVTRFEARVLELMADAGHADTRLPHVNLTRHLDLEGTRITELARRAHMTNAAMTELIDQCEVLGLVVREVDASDKRARTVQFTDAGRAWLAAFGKAVKKAERELLAEIGPEAAAVLLQDLARYAGAVESIRVKQKTAVRLRSDRAG
jgi:DNA-binding MarR family transcriptional regulator